MRLNLKITKNIDLVPFDYQRFLVGVFHKWLGENEIHNDLSLYSLSWLIGGKLKGKGLDFIEGAEWFISSFDHSLIRQLIRGITSDPAVCFGMKVTEVMIQETPDFGIERRFSVDSPVLVKKMVNGEQKHLGFEEFESDKIMTKILQAKLEKAGLESGGVEVVFDRAYLKAKHKLVNYRGIGNKANVCPVIVRGNPEQVAFAWNVGVGHSTGIGFGALN